MPSPSPGQTPRAVVLLPVYNDWDCLKALLPRLDRAALQCGLLLHVVVVDDGSAEPAPGDLLGDFTCEAIGGVEVVRLHVNVGHQSAIAVGLSEVHRRHACDAVIVMDADGEDRPEDLDALLEAHRKHPGAIVVARRSRRSEPVWFRIFYAVYKWIFRLFVGSGLDYGNYCLIPGSMLGRLAYSSMTWNHLAAAIARSGLPVVRVDTLRGHRVHGRSRMSFERLVTHGLSAVTVFLDVVMIRILIVSSAIMLLSLIGVLVVVWLRLFTELAIPGWATSAVGLLSVIGLQGLVLSTMASFVVLRGRSGGGIIPAIDAPKYIDRVEKVLGDG